MLADFLLYIKHFSAF